jgi:FAD/FMN-containing dehydrogenase
VSTEPTTEGIDLDALRAAVAGQVIEQGDDGYEAARTVFPGNVDRRPDVIVRPAGEADVARVVVAARDASLPLAVKSGGHSPAGHGVSEGGITLDLSSMDALELDAEGLTAWAEPGITAGAYTQAAGALGLATGFGDTASVGVGGITLAGGIGFLVRAHGMTIDNLLAAEVVTADGELRHVDEEQEPDLFWALRGGGGNVGVATRLRFRLHALPAVAGGVLVLPAPPETVLALLAAAAAAPDALPALANVMPAPPMPFLPEEAHGRLVILGLLLYAGDPEAGMRALAPFRAIAPPVADLLRPMTYPEIYFPEDEGYRPIAANRTSLTDHLGPSVAATIVERLGEPSTAMMRVAQLRVLGGAMARVPADATAFAHRERRLMVTAAAMVDSVERLPEQTAWVEETATVLRGPDAAAYVGFLADEGEARIREAYPPSTWERLARIKARYDPTNVFRSNQNVPPATDGA